MTPDEESYIHSLVFMNLLVNGVPQLEALYRADRAVKLHRWMGAYKKAMGEFESLRRRGLIP